LLENTSVNQTNDNRVTTADFFKNKKVGLECVTGMGVCSFSSVLQATYSMPLPLIADGDIQGAAKKYHIQLQMLYCDSPAIAQNVCTKIYF